MCIISQSLAIPTIFIHHTIRDRGGLSIRKLPGNSLAKFVFLSSQFILLPLGLLAKIVHWENHESRLSIFWGSAGPPTPEDIPDPSHGRVFHEKFRSVYVVKGVWSLLTDLLLNRQSWCFNKAVSLPNHCSFSMSTIMGVAKLERDLWWLSLFVKVRMENEFVHFLIERPPQISNFCISGGESARNLTHAIRNSTCNELSEVDF